MSSPCLIDLFRISGDKSTPFARFLKNSKRWLERLSFYPPSTCHIASREGRLPSTRGGAKARQATVIALCPLHAKQTHPPEARAAIRQANVGHFLAPKYFNNGRVSSSPRGYPGIPFVLHNTIHCTPTPWDGSRRSG